MKVLFVCAGNVGRSQQAAAYFNKIANGHAAVSAGTHVEREGKEGQLVSEQGPLGFVVAKEAGLDLSSARSRQVTAAMVEEAGKVVVMTAASDCPEFVRRSPKTIFWEVQDPREMDYAGRKRILRIIQGKVDELVKELGKRSVLKS